MKTIAVVIGIVAVVAVTAGAVVYTGIIEMLGEPTVAMDAVPGGVDVVGVAYWDKMISDPDVQSLVDKFIEGFGGGEFSSFDEAYGKLKEEAMDKAGIDPDKVASVVFFAKIPATYGTKPPEYLGLILEGDLDKAEIIAEIREQDAEIKEETHNGVAVSVISIGQEPEGAIAELDNLLLFGTKNAVFDSIDAKKGGARLTGELKNKFESVKGNFIKIAAEIPEELREQMEEAPAGGAPIDISMFSKIEYVTYGLNKKGVKFSEQVLIITTDKSSAKDIADLIEGAMKMYSAMAPEEIKEVMDKYVVTQSDATVKIESEMTVEELEKTIESITELSKAPPYSGGW